MRCRPLSLSEGLRLASLALDLPAEELATEESMMRLRLALNTTGAEVAGSETFEAIADKAAAMTVSLVTRPPFQPGSGRIAWYCLIEFLRRNGWRWRGNEQTSLVRLEQEARAAGVSVDLWDWVIARVEPGPSAPPSAGRRPPSGRVRRRRGQQPLFSPDPAATTVVAYLAGPVASLDDDELAAAGLLGDEIEHCLREAVREADLTWMVKLLHPSWALRPQRAKMSDRQLWQHNRALILGETDALVITDVGLKAAGFGAAMELDLHCLQDGPVLYLEQEGCPGHSRYLKGRTGEVDLTVRSYRRVEDIPRLIKRWLKDRANAIETASVRRADRALQYFPLLHRLLDAWTHMDASQRLFAAGTSRLKPELINAALSSVEDLYTLPAHKLDALCAALGVDRVHTELGELQAIHTPAAPDYEALLSVALPQRWPVGDIERVFRRAQADHADAVRSGAMLRNRWGSAADWSARRGER
jgi:prophage maintenance system killer protein